MDIQFVLNIAFGSISFLAGWLIRILWSAIKDLQRNERALSDKVASIEVLVAGTYVRRTDLEKLTDAIFKELRYISEKLDRKADK